MATKTSKCSLSLSLVLPLSFSLALLSRCFLSSSSPPVTPTFDAFSSREVRIMESETKKTYDAVWILRSLEFAYSIAPLSHGRRPFAFVTQICDYDVLVTTVFVFKDDGTLAGCLGEFFFWPNPELQHQHLVQPIIALFSPPPPPPLQQASTT